MTKGELSFAARMVQIPVRDLGEALSFYDGSLGWQSRFRDADRYAVLDAGDVTVALASSAESLAVTTPALAVRVDDVSAAVERLVHAGASVLTPTSAGPHEVRAALRDPLGHAFIVYSPSTTA